MANYLYNFDFRRAHPDLYRVFYRQALKRRLTYVFRTSSDVRRLPYSTLWTVRPDIASAGLAIDRAIKATEAILRVEDVLEKLMVVQFVDWSNTSNLYKPPVRRWLGKTRLDTAMLHQENDPDFDY